MQGQRTADGQLAANRALQRAIARGPATQIIVTCNSPHRLLQVYQEAIALSTYFEQKGWSREQEYQPAREYVKKLEEWSETIRYPKNSLKKTDFEDVIRSLRVQLSKVAIGPSVRNPKRKPLNRHAVARRTVCLPDTTGALHLPQPNSLSPSGRNQAGDAAEAHMEGEVKQEAGVDAGGCSASHMFAMADYPLRPARRGSIRRPPGPRRARRDRSRRKLRDWGGAGVGRVRAPSAGTRLAQEARGGGERRAGAWAGRQTAGRTDGPGWRRREMAWREGGG